MFLTKNSQSPYYQIIYFVNGKRTKKSTKTSLKKEAEKYLLNFQIQFNPNQNIQKINNINLSELQKEYLEYISSTRSKSYIRSVKLSFKQFQNFTNDIPLIRIDNRLIDNFITNVFSKSKYAAALYHRTLKAAFSKAVDWNYLEINPFKKVKLPKIPKHNPLFVTIDEFQKIISNTKKDYLKNIFYTAFYTGMRLGEILNMKWSWVNLNDKIISVKCDENFLTKSKKERVIPINNFLIHILLNQYPKVININKDDFIFTRIKGIKLNEDFISKQFKKSVRAAQLNDKIHFHSLRHSFASNLVQKGVSLYVVKELLGHEDIKTTQIYAHLQQENLYQAVNLL